MGRIQRGQPLQTRIQRALQRRRYEISGRRVGSLGFLAVSEQRKKGQGCVAGPLQGVPGESRLHVHGCRAVYWHGVDVILEEEEGLLDALHR
jgi:hypothetical protein